MLQAFRRARVASRSLHAVLTVLGFWLSAEACANPPVASFIFPAGGQRGATVPVRVGGLFLHKSCGFELLGPGVSAPAKLKSTKTLWFEGPLLPLPDSQRQEDYPKDMAGEIKIAGDAPLGLRVARLWTSEGAASGLRFEVGDLPEIVEQEIDGDPVPTLVATPLTVNGRIFPRENIDSWAFAAKKGQTFHCTVAAQRFGSPLEPHLEVRDAQGRFVVEGETLGSGDAYLRFTAPSDGTYHVRIRDIGFQGSPAHVYRLTISPAPHLERVYPLGGQRGTTVLFELHGAGLPNATAQVPIPREARAEFAHRFPTIAGRWSNPVVLDVDDLPEHRETEPNDVSAAQAVNVPAVVNGRIDRPGDIDCWSLALKKGEPIAIELRAARLGSPLQGVLALHDAAGKEVGRAESNPPAEAALSFTAPADGTYLLKVADRFKARGGPAFAYRVRIAPPGKEPGFRLKLKADTLTLPRAGQSKLALDVDRLGGYQGPITLTVDGLPVGVTVTGTTIAANQNNANLDFKVDKSAPITSALLTLRGSAVVAGKTLTGVATLQGTQGEPPVESVRAAVALPCPFKVSAAFQMRLWSRGTSSLRPYKIERNGYQGPIEVSLADKQARHLQGASGPTIVVPAGKSEFDYPVYLPPWMETGRTCRVCVQAVGVVRDGGVDHEVSYSATGQNDQFIAVVETGRLEVTAERSTILITPGKTIAVPIRVSRGKGLVGPAKVELILADHVRGIAAEPLSIPAGQSAADLTVRIAPGNVGPLNMPATLRATIADASGPIVGETRLELLEPRR